MSKLPALNYRQFTKKIKKVGFKFYRQARGSHEIWFNPKTKRFVTIPRHPGRDFKKGTLNQMIKDTGLMLKEFLRL